MLFRTIIRRTRIAGQSHPSLVGAWPWLWLYALSLYRRYTVQCRKCDTTRLFYCPSFQGSLSPTIPSQSDHSMRKRSST
jgi:hypothetical protein